MVREITIIESRIKIEYVYNEKKEKEKLKEPIIIIMDKRRNQYYQRIKSRVEKII